MTLKNVVIWMPESSCFRTPLKSQRVQGYEEMLKWPWQYLYPKFPLIQDRLRLKTSLLVRFETLGVFGNTLTADHMYCRHYLREISAMCSSTINSKRENIFWNFCCIFAIYTEVCVSWKKNQLHRLNISEVIDSEICRYFNARKLLVSNILPE